MSRARQLRRQKEKAMENRYGIPMSAAEIDLLNTGFTAQKKGDVEGAGRAFITLLNTTPRQPFALYGLGAVAIEQGKHEQAVALTRQAIQELPGKDMFHAQLGRALFALNEFEAARLAFEDALAIAPKNIIALKGLGDCYAIQRDDPAARQKAIATYENVIAADPTNTEMRSVRHMIAALRGEKLTDTQGSATYAENLFNSYADRFDASLTETLEYQTPHLLTDLLAGHGLVPDAGWVIVDAGCGTGLCGLHLKPAAARLVGVDISEKMLDKAKERSLYDRLIKGELSEALGAFEGEADLILSADVFVYVGALEATFAAAHKALKAGGLFAFSTEKASAEELAADEAKGAAGEVILRRSGRFAHATAYVERLATPAGFEILAQKESPIRKEQGAFLTGDLFVLRKV